MNESMAALNSGVLSRLSTAIQLEQANKPLDAFALYGQALELIGKALQTQGVNDSTIKLISVAKNCIDRCDAISKSPAAQIPAPTSAFSAYDNSSLMKQRHASLPASAFLQMQQQQQQQQSHASVKQPLPPLQQQQQQFGNSFYPSPSPQTGGYPPPPPVQSQQQQYPFIPQQQQQLSQQQQNNRLSVSMYPSPNGSPNASMLATSPSLSQIPTMLPPPSPTIPISPTTAEAAAQQPPTVVLPVPPSLPKTHSSLQFSNATSQFDPRQMSAGEITQKLHQVDAEMTNLQNALKRNKFNNEQEMMFTKKRVDDLKASKTFLEESLRMIQKQQEFAESKAKRRMSGSSNFFSSLRKTLSFSSTKQDKHIMFINKNFRYLEMKNQTLLAIDNKWLADLKFKHNDEEFIRNHINNIASESHHALCYLLDAYEIAFKKEFSAEGATWFNVAEAIADVKQFRDKLVMYLLSLPEWENSYINTEFGIQVLNQTLLEILCHKLYDNLMVMYSTQRQIKEKEAHLQSINFLSLEELGLPEVLLLPEDEAPYQSAIYKLNELNDIFGSIRLALPILTETTKLIFSCINEYWSARQQSQILSQVDETQTIGIYLYVLLKANIPRAITILSMIEEFMDPAVMNSNSEAKYCLTMLNAAVEWSMHLEFAEVDAEHSEDKSTTAPVEQQPEEVNSSAAAQQEPASLTPAAQTEEIITVKPQTPQQQEQPSSVDLLQQKFASLMTPAGVFAQQQPPPSIPSNAQPTPIVVVAQEPLPAAIPASTAPSTTLISATEVPLTVVVNENLQGTFNITKHSPEPDYQLTGVVEVRFAEYLSAVEIEELKAKKILSFYLQVQNAKALINVQTNPAMAKIISDLGSDEIAIKCRVSVDQLLQKSVILLKYQMGPSKPAPIVIKVAAKVEVQPSPAVRIMFAVNPKSIFSAETPLQNVSTLLQPIVDPASRIMVNACTVTNPQQAPFIKFSREKQLIEWTVPQTASTREETLLNITPSAALNPIPKVGTITVVFDSVFTTMQSKKTLSEIAIDGAEGHPSAVYSQIFAGGFEYKLKGCIVFK